MSARPPPPPQTDQQIAKEARHHLRQAIATLRRFTPDERIARIVSALEGIDDRVLSPLSKGREPRP